MVSSFVSLYQHFSYFLIFLFFSFSFFPLYIDLYEEKAILLSRLGQHRQALVIYAYNLENPEFAEKYIFEREKKKNIF